MCTRVSGFPTSLDQRPVVLQFTRGKSTEYVFDEDGKVIQIPNMKDRIFIYRYFTVYRA